MFGLDLSMSLFLAFYTLSLLCFFFGVIVISEQLLRVKKEIEKFRRQQKQHCDNLEKLISPHTPPELDPFP